MSCFSFWKAVVKCPSLTVNGVFWWRQTWRHLHVTMLKCGAKFSNVLVRWSIRMIRAKNYEIVSTFVKVIIQKKNRGLFFRTRCTYKSSQAYVFDISLFFEWNNNSTIWKQLLHLQSSNIMRSNLVNFGRPLPFGGIWPTPKRTIGVCWKLIMW